jgi:hypothetical protein
LRRVEVIKMYNYMKLDIDNIARIGLIYLDGDKLEDILLDKYGHTDYHFENFNAVKKSLLKLERIDPGLDLTAVLWQLRPDNSELAVPVAAGNALPVEGWQRTKVNDEMRVTFDKGINMVKKRSDTCTSYYYAVKNSDAEIVGVLELLHGYRVKGDI